MSKVSYSFCIAVLLAVTTACTVQFEETSEPSRTSETISTAEFPELRNADDGVLENIMRDFFKKYEDESWWSRIDYIKEGWLGNEVAKTAYVYTTYRMDSADDVEDATEFCNALVSFVPRSGLSVSMRGHMIEGSTRLDGTLETRELTDQPMALGRSWRPDFPPKWCVANTYFTSVRSELDARGWNREYTPDLTAEQLRKQYSDAFIQDGKIFMRN